MDILTQARNLLDEKQLTLVLAREEGIIALSRERGVRPMNRLLDGPVRLTGAVVADRVVGKAVALMFLLAGIREVYAGQISTPARNVLEAGDVRVVFGEEVPYVLNRDGSGQCPLEASVLACEDPAEGLSIIRETLEKLQKKPDGGK